MGGVLSHRPADDARFHRLRRAVGAYSDLERVLHRFHLDVVEHHLSRAGRQLPRRRPQSGIWPHGGGGSDAVAAADPHRRHFPQIAADRRARLRRRQVRDDMASVTIENVRKSYGNTEVVHGVSLDIADGAFVVLLGPSGCGKSTLLRMIAGLEKITSGEISIGGRVVNDVHPGDRDIAMVFQNYALYAHMNVFDNMSFAMTLKKAPRAEIDAQVKWAASILGLGDFLQRFPRQLSGGQRQRVAMGRAIVRDPAVFLFDEPLSNLDAKLRVQMRTEIKE